MATNFFAESPSVLRDFLVYHETIRGHSRLTTEHYFYDLRLFFRFLKQRRGLVESYGSFDDIGIHDVDVPFLAQVTLSEVYDFLHYLNREQPKQKNSAHTGFGVKASTRARKVVAVRTFYKYLVNKARVITENPLRDLDSPKVDKRLPKHLTLSESVTLLSGVEGRHSVRDYCILTLFLNCGLRISEVSGINLSDIRDDSLRIIGKGNKERIVFLNDACQSALADYLSIRAAINDPADPKALFLSAQKKRIGVDMLHKLVKKHLLSAGLDSTQFSAHKLRHTAATLMLQNGVDIRALQEVLGHEHLNTTQIYTHVDNEDLRVAARANPLSRVRRKEE
jgi:site-specific recombinase XerD